MIWFFSGAWIDSSAHTYLIDDIETFFTPWHALLYSGYAFSVLVAMYIKNNMKDYKVDVGVLGAVVFGIGGASDAIWHTLFGIETDKVCETLSKKDKRVKIESSVKKMLKEEESFGQLAEY